MRAALGKAVVESIQDPAHQEVLLDVDQRGAESPGRREKEIRAVGQPCTDETNVHVCVHVFLFVPADMTGLRKISCIQIGMVERPMRRSSVSFGPFLLSVSSFRMVRSILARSVSPCMASWTQRRA